MGYLPGDRAPSRRVAEAWFGDAGRPGVRGVGIAPLIAAEGMKVASGLIHPSSTPGSNAATDQAAARVRAGDANALAFLIQQGGMTSNGGWHGAVGKGADAYARAALNTLIAEGFVTGPVLDGWRTLPSGAPANNPALWQLAQSGAANPFGDVVQPSGPRIPSRVPGSPPGGPALLGLQGGSLTTLALIGLGAFVLSKVVK